VFEIQPPEGGAQSALGGGGRYDDLMETLGGVATPALGYATGLERIILNLKEGQIIPPPLPGPAIFIAGLGVEATEEALLLAVLLRNSGIGVFQASADRSLKSQLRQANGLGARFVVIIGEEELINKQVILRDMTTGKQDDLPTEEILKELKKRLF
ncbi:MAG: ATP phosphoribosyltransferase regulatory subunit, partial [Chloroflexi bacterium]|nr:ATP phosphoribosyltransferase regulatory subunit [Chloroflexota bacterium]